MIQKSISFECEPASELGGFSAERVSAFLRMLVVRRLEAWGGGGSGSGNIGVPLLLLQIAV